MIEIRRPSIVDSHAISALLNSLGYPDTEPFIERRISQLVAHQDADILVATVDGTVVGFVSLHFIPQLALARDFCRITYFCVSEAHRNLGIGSLLESKVVSLAKKRGCTGIEVHCHSKRVDAHRFYFQHSYLDSPKYLFKTVAGI